MTESHRLSAERNSLQDLYKSALDIENGKRSTAHLEKMHRMTTARMGVSSTSSPSSGAFKTEGSTNKKSSSGRFRSGGTHRTSHRSDGRHARFASTNLGQAPAPARPPAKPTQTSRPVTGTGVGSSKGQCFACGGMGHFAKDPSCPMYSNKPRLFAQRIIDEDADGDEVLPKGEDRSGYETEVETDAERGSTLR